MQKDDIISRQQAIDKIKNYCENGCDIAEDNWCPSCQREQFIELLKVLPPAQPKTQEGEWVQIQRCARDAQPDLECPFCKHRIGWFDTGKYCAKCGAKLKGGAA